MAAGGPGSRAGGRLSTAVGPETMVATASPSRGGRRLVAAAGLTAVALNLPAFLLVPPAPALGTETADIVGYYQDAGRPFLLYSWLVALSVPFLIVHLAAVSEWLRRRELPGLAATYFASGLMAHTVQLLLLAFAQLAGMAAMRGDAEAARTLADLGTIGFSFCALAEVARQVAGGLAIRETGVVPRWISWLAFSTAGLCLLGSVGLMTRSGGLAAGSLPMVLWLLGFLITFATVNVALLVSAGRAADPAGGRHRRSADGRMLAAVPNPAPAAAPAGAPAFGRAAPAPAAAFGRAAPASAFTRPPSVSVSVSPSVSPSGSPSGSVPLPASVRAPAATPAVEVLPVPVPIPAAAPQSDGDGEEPFSFWPTERPQERPQPRR